MKKILLVIFSLFIKCLLEASVLISSIQYVNEDNHIQPEGQFVLASGEIKFYLEFICDKKNDDGETPTIDKIVVTGSPTLSFKIGGVTKHAKFVESDGPYMLFTYTIQPDDLGYVQFYGSKLLNFVAANSDNITAEVSYENGDVSTDNVVKIPGKDSSQIVSFPVNPVTKFNEWYGSSDAAENYIWVKIEPYLTCEDSLVTGEGDYFDYAELSINRALDSSVTYTIEYPLDANGNPLVTGPATLKWPAGMLKATLSKMKALDNFETNIVLRGDNGLVFSLPVVATNEAPHINNPWEGDNFEGRIGEVLSFSASASDVVSEIYDPLTYVWDFGDGKGHVLGQNVTYSYTDGGTYLITLTVNDDDGGVVSRSYQTFIAYQEEDADGIVWTYIVKNGEAEIYGDVNTSAIPEETTGAITIPSMLGGYPVMKIGDFAFSGCYNLTNITIPDSVTSIGDDAFAGCYEAIDLETIPGVKLVDGWVVGYCYEERPVNLDLTGARGIGDDAFSYYDSLTNITIPDSVTHIGDDAFEYCRGLTSITIPDSVTSIGDSVFFGCSGLTSITIPDSVTSIGEYAFLGSSGLTSITIPDSVTSIGDEAFYWCSNLKSAIFLGDAPRDVGTHIFDDCADDFVIKVRKGTKGWNEDPNSTELPETWNGYPITYCEEYKVVYNANGGSGSMSDQSFIIGVEQALAANTFSREGYTFAGWATSENGAVVYADKVSVKNLTTEVDGVVELYAVWEVGTVPNPVINPPNGSKFAGNSCIVTISCELDGAIIYYSPNGVTPRLTDAYRYEGPFVITNTSTIKTIAVFDGFKSDYVTAVITKDDITLSEAAGAEELVFTTGGDADWCPIVDASSPSGYSVESGEIGCMSTTWMKTTASGEGIFSFKWKVDCEHDDDGSFSWDRATVYTNDIEVACIDGTSTEWEEVSIVFNDDGEHTIMWDFYKDDYDEEDADYLDAAWVTGVTWTPLTSIDPIPEISDVSEIAKALDGSADSRLAENITSLAGYNLFREWATSLPNTTLDEVKASSTAWMSFALDQSKLIANEPVEGDVAIASLDAVAADGSFEFTVNIDKIDVGDGAVEENLKKLFRIEGATSLGNDANFSSENVDIELAEPVNGDVKFKIIPKDSPDSFFIRATLLK